MKSTRLAITGDGLTVPLKTEIKEGGFYYFGASSSPEVIMITKVTSDLFWYVNHWEYLHTPTMQSSVIERWIGEDLIARGNVTYRKQIENSLKLYGDYQKNTVGYKYSMEILDHATVNPVHALTDSDIDYSWEDDNNVYPFDTITCRSEMKLYASVSRDFGAQFAFYAVNDEDASDKMAVWNHYHSFTGDEKHTSKRIIESNLSELRIGIHDEYMS